MYRPNNSEAEEDGYGMRWPAIQLLKNEGIFVDPSQSAMVVPVLPQAS